VRGSGRPSGPGACDRAAGARAEAARGGRSGSKRRCSSVPASAAPKSRREMAGKEEGRAEKLTGGLNRAEVDRRLEIDGEGRSSRLGDGERQLGLLGSAVHSVHGRGKGNGEA